MKTENRVAWTEGMFLRVQHFQQADRWAEHLVKQSLRPLVAYPWGLTELNVDTAALTIGRFALTGATGLFPDGSAFTAPDQADLPPHVDLAEGVQNVDVFLALPAQRPGLAEFRAEGTEAITRHFTDRFEAEDSVAGNAFSAEIAVGRLQLSLKLSTDELAGFELLRVARIVEVRPDRAVILDEAFIPTSLSAAAAPQISGFLIEILGLVRHRADAIASRIGDPSVRGTAEVGDYLMLQALNRVDPLLAHLAGQAGQIHPELVYRTFTALAGELATFASDRKRATSFPDYRHDEPAETFAPVMAELRQFLSTVLDRSAVPIPLEERRHGVRVASISDRSLLDAPSFVLAIRADMAEEAIRRGVPPQIKIGSVDRIAELVNVALPGIGVKALPVVPRQLPYRRGTVYFELETGDKMWDQVAESATLAVHIAADLPGLEIELWAIRS